VNELARRVHSLGGLVIPAHADRSAFSLTSQFGYVIDGDWDAIELVKERVPVGAGKPPFPDKPVTHSSDAHYIADIAFRSCLLDTGDEPPQTAAGEADIEVIRRALTFLSAHR
jgi:hypothetical protein